MHAPTAPPTATPPTATAPTATAAGEGQSLPSLAGLSARLERDANNRLALYQRASLYLREGEFVPALVDADKLVALSPKNVSALVLRGNIRATFGGFDAAIENFSQAIEIAPARVASAYTGRGEALTQKGEMDKAMADFDKAFAIEPRLVAISLGRANVYEKQKDWKKAIALYSQIVERIPATRSEPHMRARLARAKVWMQSDDVLSGTMELLDIADSDTKYFGEAAFVLGVKAFEEKAYDLVRQRFERAVEGKYLPAQAMLEKTRQAMAGGANGAATDEAKELSLYIKRLNALIAQEKPFIEKLNATAEGDHKNESLNRAALHPKTQAVVDFIAAESPRLAGFEGERAQKARDASQNALAKRKESLHSTRTFQVTAYRVLGEWQGSQAVEKEYMARMTQARKDNNQAAWQEAKTDLRAQARVTRQLLVDGLKLLAPYNNDPEQPALKTSLETSLATQQKTIEVMQK